MAAREPGRLAYETFTAHMKSRLHLKWDYDLFSKEEKEAWAAVEAKILDEAAKCPTVRPEGPICPYCSGDLTTQPETETCPFPPSAHEHLRCSKCSQVFVYPVDSENRQAAQ